MPYDIDPGDLHLVIALGPVRAKRVFAKAAAEPPRAALLAQPGGVVGQSAAGSAKPLGGTLPAGELKPRTVVFNHPLINPKRIPEYGQGGGNKASPAGTVYRETWPRDSLYYSWGPQYGEFGPEINTEYNLSRPNWDPSRYDVPAESKVAPPPGLPAGFAKGAAWFDHSTITGKQVGWMPAEWPADGSALAEPKPFAGDPDAAAEARSVPTDPALGGYDKLVPPQGNWLQDNMPLLLAGGAGLGLAGGAGLAWWQNRKKRQALEAAALADGGVEAEPVKAANRPLGPLEALAASRAEGHQAPFVVKHLAAANYSDAGMPVRGAWARAHGAAHGGQQLTEGAKYVSPAMRRLSAMAGDAGGTGGDNLFEDLGYFSDPRNIGKARDAYAEKIAPYRDEPDPAPASEEQVEHALGVTPRTLMNAADVVGADAEIAGHRYNRHNRPGHYWLNPFVSSGPLSEIAARLHRRGAAEKADPDAAFRASLYVPGVPTARGLLGGHNPEKREKARALALAALGTRSGDDPAAYRSRQATSPIHFNKDSAEKRAGPADWTLNGTLDAANPMPAINSWADGRIGNAVNNAAGNIKMPDFSLPKWDELGSWAPGAIIGGVGGAGLGLVGGLSSRKKDKRNALGDALTGGLLGAAGGGLLGAGWDVGKHLLDKKAPGAQPANSQVAGTGEPKKPVPLGGGLEDSTRYAQPDLAKAKAVGEAGTPGLATVPKVLDLARRGGNAQHVQTLNEAIEEYNRAQAAGDPAAAQAALKALLDTTHQVQSQYAAGTAAAPAAMSAVLGAPATYGTADPSRNVNPTYGELKFDKNRNDLVAQRRPGGPDDARDAATRAAELQAGAQGVDKDLDFSRRALDMLVARDAKGNPIPLSIPGQPQAGFWNRARNSTFGNDVFGVAGGLAGGRGLIQAGRTLKDDFANGRNPLNRLRPSDPVAANADAFHKLMTGRGATAETPAAPAAPPGRFGRATGWLFGGTEPAPFRGPATASTFNQFSTDAPMINRLYAAAQQRGGAYAAFSRDDIARAAGDPFASGSPVPRDVMATLSKDVAGGKGTTWPGESSLFGRARGAVGRNLGDLWADQRGTSVPTAVPSNTRFSSRGDWFPRPNTPGAAPPPPAATPGVNATMGDFYPKPPAAPSVAPPGLGFNRWSVGSDGRVTVTRINPTPEAVPPSVNATVGDFYPRSATPEPVAAPPSAPRPSAPTAPPRPPGFDLRGPQPSLGARAGRFALGTAGKVLSPIHPRNLVPALTVAGLRHFGQGSPTTTTAESIFGAPPGTSLPDMALGNYTPTVPIEQTVEMLKSLPVAEAQAELTKLVQAGKLDPQQAVQVFRTLHARGGNK